MRRTAIILGILALVLVLASAGFLASRFRMEPTEVDKQTLVSVADLGVKPGATPERWSKRRALGGGVKVSYECTGLGKSGKASVISWRMDFGLDHQATLAFEGGLVGQKAGFAAAASPTERREELPLPELGADQISATSYLVNDAPAGGSVLLRKGRRILFFAFNGYTVSQPVLEDLIQKRVALLARLDADG